MAYFRDNDPRHPRNRCRLMYHAFMQAPGVGEEIPSDKLRVMIKLATGTSSQRAIKDYRQDLCDYGMIKSDGETVTVLPDGLLLID